MQISMTSLVIFLCALILDNVRPTWLLHNWIWAHAMNNIPVALSTLSQDYFYIELLLQMVIEVCGLLIFYVFIFYIIGPYVIYQFGPCR